MALPFGRNAQMNTPSTGAVIKRLIVALPLFTLFTGCGSNEPRETVRTGSAYQEEIKSPLPRQMLIDPTCAVR